MEALLFYIFLILSLQFTLLYPIASSAPTTYIVPFAGTGTNGYGGDNGPATSAQINIPTSVWSDSNGYVYIGEDGGQRIRKVDLNGNITTFGGNGVLNSNGASGTFTSISFYYVNGMYGTRQFLYVSDNVRVFRYNFSSGLVMPIAGGSYGGFSGDGGPATSALFNVPMNLFVSTAGDIFVPDALNNRVRVIDGITNNVTTFAGGGTGGNNIPATSAAFNLPCGVYIDSNSYVYIASTYSHQVWRVNTTNIISVFAGTGASSHSGDDGDATSAGVLYPVDVKGDSLGVIYIASRDACRVRTVVGGIITTFLGNGFCTFSTSPIVAPGSIGQVWALYVDPEGNVFLPGDDGIVVRTVTYGDPSGLPTSRPSQPTGIPSGRPASLPSTQPTRRPSSQPSSRPSVLPSSQPSSLPSSQPSVRPSTLPSAVPSRQPTSRPSSHPSRQPSSQPSSQPICQPSSQPSSQPSRLPSSQPSGRPSRQPSSVPSRQPTSRPSAQPSSQPTRQPSSLPSSRPSQQPSSRPSHQPTALPSSQPSAQPSVQPNARPSAQPSSRPSGHPSSQPSSHPSGQPTTQPSRQPSSVPSSQPTSRPSGQPSSQPTRQPSSLPSSRPSQQPSSRPSHQPTALPSSQPSAQPSVQPNARPSAQPSSRPSGHPSSQPSSHPSGQPTTQPSRQPSSVPSSQPTSRPSGQPSSQPTRQPSSWPSSQPSRQPFSHPSGQPTTQPSRSPIGQPSAHPSTPPSSIPSRQPSSLPSSQPTSTPSSQPIVHPSAQPSSIPSMQPTTRPSCQPSYQPTAQPSAFPISRPTGQPTGEPSRQPTVLPSNRPTTQPSSRPSCQPIAHPSVEPTCIPSSLPSIRPSTQPSGQPTSQPSQSPIGQPSACPSTLPSSLPSLEPSSWPSGQPSVYPSTQPSSMPSIPPTAWPSCQPSSLPSAPPTSRPTGQPTGEPSGLPIAFPSSQPTALPSGLPSCCPTSRPSINPASLPSPLPSDGPSGRPSTKTSSPPFSALPSISPSSCPSSVLVAAPSSSPSVEPTVNPSSPPSLSPWTTLPSLLPSRCPRSCPSTTPTTSPSSSPSLVPSSGPSSRPSRIPSVQPSTEPSGQPHSSPSAQPTRQPASHPTALPSRRPSSQPSSRPSASPTFSVSSLNTRRPTRWPTWSPTVYHFNNGTLPFTLPVVIHLADRSVDEFRVQLFPFTAVSPSRTDLLTNLTLRPAALGKQFVIFGEDRERGAVDLSEQHSQSFDAVGKGLSIDLSFHSIALVRSANNDSFLDLLVGNPFRNQVFLLFGQPPDSPSFLFSEGLTISGESSEDQLGWAVSSAGDFDGDGTGDLLLSSMVTGRGYLLYGRAAEKFSNLRLSRLSAQQGLRITSDEEGVANLGIALSSAGDFNGDGLDDILLTGRGWLGANVIYLVYGHARPRAVSLSLKTMTAAQGTRIVAAAFSFAGLSLSDLGDVNGDGLDDIVLGSVPYRNGYTTQLAYVVYGRNSSRDNSSNQSLSLSLASLPPARGFSIVGGGLLVGRAGDVDGDGRDDVLVVSYPDWQAQQGGLVLAVSSARRVSREPSLLPSSAPSAPPSSQPTHMPIESTSSPTSLPSSQPSYRVGSAVSSRPTRFSSASPTVSPSARPSKRPSLGPTVRPSLAPSESPTLSPSQEPSQFPSRAPSAVPSINLQPTSAPTAWPTFSASTASLVVPVREGGWFVDESSNASHPVASELFLVDVHSDVTITGNAYGRSIYRIFPAANVTASLVRFDRHRDVLDLSLIASITGLDTISYHTNPLSLSLGGGQFVVFLSVEQFDELSAGNFYFSDGTADNPGLGTDTTRRSAEKSPRGFLRSLNDPKVVTALSFFSLLTVLTYFGLRFGHWLDKFVAEKKKEKNMRAAVADLRQLLDDEEEENDEEVAVLSQKKPARPPSSSSSSSSSSPSAPLQLPAVSSRSSSASSPRAFLGPTAVADEKSREKEEEEEAKGTRLGRLLLSRPPISLAAVPGLLHSHRAPPRPLSECSSSPSSHEPLVAASEVRSEWSWAMSDEEEADESSPVDRSSESSFDSSSVLSSQLSLFD